MQTFSRDKYIVDNEIYCRQIQKVALMKHAVELHCCIKKV